IAREVFETKSMTNARRRWRDEGVWFEMFAAFWGFIRDRYVTLWNKGASNQLFVGAHLWALQETLLLALDGQAASFWHVDPTLEVEERAIMIKRKLLETVGESLDYFPDELWTTPWDRTGLDTTKGREDLVDLLKRFVDAGKRGSGWRNWKQDPWFKS